ncbi:MAG TPA: flagellar hook-associated protein FlgK [Terriglobales bacterium]|nr:flagellar hook-associated protein FlgK [Terriglobales bacterium]
MSLSSILSIARSALLAQQRAMSVTAHNVANAQTPGYSRQILQLTADEPLWTPQGEIGRGVVDAGVARARDAFFDARYRSESGLLGDSSALRDYLGQLEAAVNEPSDIGLAASLDGFFHSLSDLANDPADATYRSLVVQGANRLVSQFHQLAQAVSDVAGGAEQTMRADVDQVNDLAAKIADLNQQILQYGGAAGGAPDLMDRRDLLVDQLSGLVGVRVLTRADGTIGVLAGDTLLVDGASAQTLTVVAQPTGGFGLATAAGTPVDPQSGALAALSALTTTRLPAIQARLDRLAGTLVSEVNAIHRTGYALDGSTNTDFFDPAGVTAGSIALAPAILASGDAIAASATNAPGDGAVALALSELITQGLPALGGHSLRDDYADIAASVGVDVSGAMQDAEVHQALVEQADAMRSSVSGVSVDEEMVALISQQQAFGAASRIVKAADEMVQELLNLTSGT